VARRILVVDDEPVLRMLISRAFRERGYEVVEAADGLAGLDVARSASVPFDLVVTNSHMPHMTGRTWPSGFVNSTPGCRSFISPEAIPAGGAE
jgi:CheY-like chemotaxis protein